MPASTSIHSPRMDVDELVDAALVGFDRRELITIPPLHVVARWDALDGARRGLLSDEVRMRRNATVDRIRVAAFAGHPTQSRRDASYHRQCPAKAMGMRRNFSEPNYINSGVETT